MDLIGFTGSLCSLNEIYAGFYSLEFRILIFCHFQIDKWIQVLNVLESCDQWFRNYKIIYRIIEAVAEDMQNKMIRVVHGIDEA